MDENNSKVRYSSLSPAEKRQVLRRELAEGKLQKWQYKAEMLNIAAEEREAKGIENAREDLTVRNINKRARTRSFRPFILAAAVLSTLAALFFVVRLGIHLSTFGIAASGTITGIIAAAEAVTGCVFAWLGYFGKKRWATLTAGILFAIGDCAALTLVCAVLAFIGYAAED